jgi:hypothetical protein
VCWPKSEAALLKGEINYVMALLLNNIFAGMFGFRNELQSLKGKTKLGTPCCCVQVKAKLNFKIRPVRLEK